jgi:hypothetical protein
MVDRVEFAAAARADATTYPSGRQPMLWEPGDFLLTHRESPASRLTRWGQALRIHGDDRKYTYWNHAALIVGPAGELIEAVGKGVVHSNASQYLPTEYTVVRLTADPEDRKQAVAFAEWAADHHGRFGFATIASVALTLLTGAKVSFFVDGQFICSGLVARALERTGAIFNRTSSHITPADLAKYYRINVPVGWW